MLSKRDYRDDLTEYASKSVLSKGRLYPSNVDDNDKDSFQIDRDRIINSAAFRKLSYKTQVFSDNEGDYYRTRLTHSLEVTQIARSLCKMLRANEDLVETIALAHDLGHPPFGHAGEEGLNRAMASYGGFNHNLQSFKIITKLECRHIGFDGMNLTWESIEGIVKHNGPLVDVDDAYIVEYSNLQDLELSSFSSVEGQIAAIADDIAYCNHDIDDGLRAGLLFIENLAALPVLGLEFASLDYKNCAQSRVIGHIINRSVMRMIDDVVTQTSANIKNNHIKTARDVRSLGKRLVSFSDEMLHNVRVIKSFLRKNIYSHYTVNRVTHKAKHITYSLFQLFYEEPQCLPDEWREIAENAQGKERAIVVCDFISGMTDRFALYEYSKILL